jgi:hypothetical protein
VRLRIGGTPPTADRAELTGTHLYRRTGPIEVENLDYTREDRDLGISGGVDLDPILGTPHRQHRRGSLDESLWWIVTGQRVEQSS